MNYIDPISYNLYLISYYLSKLPSYQLLEIENKKLKDENLLLNQIINSKKSNILEQNKIILYRVINYPIHQLSWSNELIRKTILSIKSIDDIINLDNLWMSLRHNTILQRLYYIIPPLIKLKNMVGLNDIKKDIFKKIIYYIQNDFNNEYLHTIISGPPGVGKTEFAILYADIFVRLGILKSNKFIEIKRDDLVGEYLGHTAPKTKKLLESAMDGVLFLDEAYSLGNPNKSDNFSKEAIDVLNQYMSEKKGEFMFIIAGYYDDIESCFFSYNKGLKRRFHSHYNIEGYKPNELKDIFLNKLKLSIYKINIDDQELLNFFNENKNNFPYYGGDIEKLVNEIKQVQALRTFNNNDNNKNIIMNDITMSMENLTNKRDRTDSHMSMYS
jgi:SpoVK/Ycf46/Vps4 family AAA+-type ATPase